MGYVYSLVKSRIVKNGTIYTISISIRLTMESIDWPQPFMFFVCLL